MCAASHLSDSNKDSSKQMKHIISLGAGVQSSTMALMAAHGEIGPMPDCAIFADTQSEPQSVYTWLDWLEKQLPFPVYRVTKGSLETVSTTIRRSKNDNLYTNGQPPAFMMIRRGEKPGILQRQCTGDIDMYSLRFGSPTSRSGFYALARESPDCLGSDGTFHRLVPDRYRVVRQDRSRSMPPKCGSCCRHGFRTYS